MVKGHKRRAIAGLTAFAASAIVAGGAVWACADDSCSAEWRLASPSFACGNQAMLNPGNDTRVNMLLLMRSLMPPRGGEAQATPANDDRQFGRTFMSWTGLRDAYWPQPTDTPSATPQAEGDAPRVCADQDPAVDAFKAALAQDRALPARERDALGALRIQMSCHDVKWDGVSVGSRPGRDYLAYLKAAAAFYGNDWATARQGFAALARARTGWVAETAHYMPIRIALRAAVAGTTDQYGDFAGTDKVDRTAVGEARGAIAAYLKAYPKGLYVDSAEGLKRRVAWLGGDNVALVRAYEKALATTPGDNEAAALLAEEIDRKLLDADDPTARVAAAGDAPLLLAIADLKQMRRGEGKDYNFPADELARQKPQFAAHADLYTLLEATRTYYAGENPKAILALLPDAAKATRFTPLAFSRQMLRGMALARTGDVNEAGFWRDMIGGAAPLFQRPLIEMGLAIRWQRDGRLSQIFAPGSPITDPATREILLQTIATPAILRSVGKDATRPARERDIAWFTLLYKDLNHGAYGDFGGDLAALPASAGVEGGLWSFSLQDKVPAGLFRKAVWAEDYACPALAQTAAALARAPTDRKAQLCLGEFYRLNGFDGFGLFRPGGEKEWLGAGADGFAGRPLSRDALYNAVIADQRAAPEERAYALYRAVMCYAPSASNSCGGSYANRAESDAGQAPIARRKAWFTELKTRYPNSRWAKSLRYYW